ncbi:hypothetical protein ACGFY9_10150 [Streptomyces sp. NPDC048504]|uniref:hypothetical protein n=1 Tax=Streptomyces sp. NPDC048504 TaxID=3365559 RepID=UPI0037192CFE
MRNVEFGKGPSRVLRGEHPQAQFEVLVAQDEGGGVVDRSLALQDGQLPVR